MTQHEQAASIWPVLAFAARMQRFLTYSDVEGLTGIPRYGQNNALFLIFSYCNKREYPLLNSIVVNQDTGFPGDEHPKKMTSEQYLVERAKVFAFNWTTKDKPSAADFEALQK